MSIEIRRTHLVTHQNPIPQLLGGWSLRGYFWVTPQGQLTGDAICREELTLYWAQGWLMYSRDGRIILTETGRREASPICCTASIQP